MTPAYSVRNEPKQIDNIVFGMSPVKRDVKVVPNPPRYWNFGPIFVLPEIFKRAAPSRHRHGDNYYNASLLIVSVIALFYPLYRISV